jgi:tetratricopeptide (TPR) repeat protein
MIFQEDFQVCLKFCKDFLFYSWYRSNPLLQAVISLVYITRECRYEICVSIYSINLNLLHVHISHFLAHFQAVLKSDRNNYIGLVLFGVALQDSEQKDQAPKAFRKAIEVSPKQLLAWQGLASFYEKENSESDEEELFPIYQQLLSLERYVLKPSAKDSICRKVIVIRGSKLRL